ncbi:hypothetical protein C8Q74DRAFT_79743 [Fomes fomentarius]|nr:hypothetical protein C8Q74DRAFT_79743 [Fomes fomentarius]
MTDTAISATALLPNGPFHFRAFSELRNTHYRHISTLDINLSASLFASSTARTFFSGPFMNLCSLTIQVTAMARTPPTQSLNFVYTKNAYPALVGLTLDGVVLQHANITMPNIHVLQLRNYPNQDSMYPLDEFMRFLRSGFNLRRLELTNYLRVLHPALPNNVRCHHPLSFNDLEELVIKDIPQRTALVFKHLVSLPPKCEVSTILEDPSKASNSVFVTAFPPGRPDLYLKHMRQITTACMDLKRSDGTLRLACSEGRQNGTEIAFEVRCQNPDDITPSLQHAALASAGGLLAHTQVNELYCAGAFEGADVSAWARMLAHTPRLQRLSATIPGVTVGGGAQALFDMLALVLSVPVNVAPTLVGVLPSVRREAICPRLESVSLCEATYSPELLLAVLRAAKARHEFGRPLHRLQLNLCPARVNAVGRDGRQVCTLVRASTAPEDWVRRLSGYVERVQIADLQVHTR